MEGRVHFCGLGKITTAALSVLAQRHDPDRFVAVSRRPRRERAPHQDVPVVGYEELAGSPGPVVLGLCADEAAAIAEHRASGVEAEELRTVVALPNLHVLDEILRGDHWQGRSILVLTNPVEVITHYLRAVTGNPRIYGLGFTTDRQRMAEALAVGFGLELESGELPVTGFHYLDPVPVLSTLPEVRRAVAAAPHSQVLRRLARYNSPYMTPGAAPTICAAYDQMLQSPSVVPGALAYDRVRAAARAITAGEFQDNKPPVRRAIDDLVADVSAWLAGEPVAVSGAEGGGLLAAGRFALPAMDGVERALVQRAYARHLRFLQQMDRQVKHTRFGKGTAS